MKIDVSIIIVNWNTKDLLSKCIQSIENNNEMYNKEIIVVDNASTDGSQEHIKINFQNVKLIQNEINLGFAKANNIGIKASKGQFICLINSDVEVIENGIDLMLDHIKKNNEIGVLGPKVINPDGTIRPNCKKFPTLWNSFCKTFALYKVFPHIDFFSDDHIRNFSYNSILEVEVLPGCCLIIRKEAINQVGLLDEKFFIYSEDKDWCKRFYDSGWKIVYSPYSTVIHYAGSSSAKAPVKYVIERLKANLLYWQKYHNKISRISFLIILLMHNFVRLVAETFLFLIRHDNKDKYSAGFEGRIASIRWILNLLIFKLKFV